MPTAGNASNLGDFYAQQGDPVAAEQYYSLVDVAFDRARSEGTNVDFEEAQFLVEHARDIDQATALAEEAFNERPKNFSTATTLAWAKFNVGDLRAAKDTVEVALTNLGEFNPKTLYIASQIYGALGDTDRAKQYQNALQATDPYVMLYNNFYNSNG